jgi:hypothetical protein
LILEDTTGESKFVTTEALANLFQLFVEQVECVLLNACYSQIQASAIAQQIPYVIGMSQEIGDEAAIQFAVGFYDGLGAGRSIEDAYHFGCSAIELDSIPEHLTPVLKTKNQHSPQNQSAGTSQSENLKDPVKNDTDKNPKPIDCSEEEARGAILGAFSDRVCFGSFNLLFLTACSSGSISSRCSS